MKQSFTYHDPDGRGTVVGIVEANMLVFGLAMRNYQDQFSRKLGRVIATGRAHKKPADAIEISHLVDEAVATTFYTKAPQLIEDKRQQIVLRTIKVKML